MKRFVLVLSLMAVMAMLFAATAVPAFAKNVKLGEGEPILSGSLNNGVHGALHCGPLFDLFGVEDVHGALTSGGGGNCVQAPRE